MRIRCVVVFGLTTALLGACSSGGDERAAFEASQREQALAALEAPAPQHIQDARIAGFHVGDAGDNLVAFLVQREGVLYAQPSEGTAKHGSLRALRYDGSLADSVRSTFGAARDAPGGAVQARWDERDATYTLTARGCYGQIAELYLQVQPRFGDDVGEIVKTRFPEDLVAFPDETFEAPAEASAKPAAPSKAQAPDRTWALVDEISSTGKQKTSTRSVRYPDLCRRMALARFYGRDWSVEAGLR